MRVQDLQPVQCDPDELCLRIVKEVGLIDCDYGLPRRRMNSCGVEKATPRMSALRTVFLEDTKPIHPCETFFLW